MQFSSIDGKHYKITNKPEYFLSILFFLIHFISQNLLIAIKFIAVEKFDRTLGRVKSLIVGTNVDIPSPDINIIIENAIVNSVNNVVIKPVLDGLVSLGWSTRGFPMEAILFNCQSIKSIDTSDMNGIHFNQFADRVFSKTRLQYIFGSKMFQLCQVCQV